MLRADDVVDQELASRAPEHTRHSVNHQQNAGMPDLNRIRIEQIRPRHRHSHVHDLRNLDDFPAVVTIGERPEVDGEKQKRRSNDRRKVPYALGANDYFFFGAFFTRSFLRLR